MRNSIRCGFARRTPSRTCRNPFACPTCVTREAPPLISKSWTASGRSFPRNSHSRKRAARSTRVSCNFTGRWVEAGSNRGPCDFRNGISIQRSLLLRSLPDGSLAMPSIEKLDTHRKALTLNLDPSTFGSFAEIGAGQEVARWFLVVGGASGTVAKTISAYDKEVSDDLYGSGSRYVSKQRLEAMLDNEWTQLLTQLSKPVGSRLGSSVLSIPSPPVTSPEPMTHMAGSVSGFSCSPGGLPTTFC